MADEKKEPGLSIATVWLMIAVAAFYDALQAIFTLIGIGWLVTPVAYATFWLWFMMNDLNFFSMKRAKWIGGSFILELIPFIDALPFFTFMIAKIVLPMKIQDVVPGANITKLDIMNRK